MAFCIRTAEHAGYCYRFDQSSAPCLSASLLRWGSAMLATKSPWHLLLATCRDIGQRVCLSEEEGHSVPHTSWIGASRQARHGMVELM